MAFIELGKIDKNLIPIIIGCVFCFLNRLINHYAETSLFYNLVLTNIFISISNIFTIIPYIILKISSKKIHQRDNQIINNNINNNIEYIYMKDDRSINKGKVGYLILTSLLFFFESTLLVSEFKLKTNTWIIYIVVVSIFCYIISKIKLYKHHYLTIIIILLLGIIIDLAEGNLQKDLINNYWFILMSLLRQSLLSLNYVIIKYIMEKKFVSVYEVSFSYGVISLIINLIFAILDHNFFGIYKYKEYFNKFNIRELFVVLGIMIIQLGMELASLITVKNNSPYHIFIICVFGQLIYYFYNLTENSVLVIICLILLLFFSLIFNEIIEINLWGLSYNTKRNITNRAKIDVDEIFNITNESFDENNENQMELNKNDIYN